MVNCIMNLLTGVYWRWTITVHGMIFNRYWSLFLLLRVNNCVGYSNYKYFYLFLMYTLILGIWFCLTSLYDIIQLWTGGLQGDAATVANKFNVTFCVIIVGIFCLSTSTLFFYHTYLIVVNKTTIESMAPPYTHRGPVSGLYNLGVRNNIKSVFGSNILLALLPVHTRLV
jgi:palmitoyltransferase